MSRLSIGCVWCVSVLTGRGELGRGECWSGRVGGFGLRIRCRRVVGGRLCQWMKTLLYLLGDENIDLFRRVDGGLREQLLPR